MKLLRFIALLAAFLLLVEPLKSQPGPDYSLPCVTKTGQLAPGIVVDQDYPELRRMKNVGGSDGAGLCVFTSIAHSFDWHAMPWGRYFREWMRKRPGGGWAEKVTNELRKYCQESRIEMPDVLQVYPTSEMKLPKIIDLMAEAVQAGHMVGMTYCYSPTSGRYGGTIAHMVNCVGARMGPDKNIWAILDNNYIDGIQWMDEKTLAKVFGGNGGGWFVAVLNRPDPPPVPRNVESK